MDPTMGASSRDGRAPSSLARNSKYDARKARRRRKQCMKNYKVKIKVENIPLLYDRGGEKVYEVHLTASSESRKLALEYTIPQMISNLEKSFEKNNKISRELHFNGHKDASTEHISRITIFENADDGSDGWVKITSWDYA